jgi:hypothetical protein
MKQIGTLFPAVCSVTYTDIIDCPTKGIHYCSCAAALKHFTVSSRLQGPGTVRSQVNAARSLETSLS